MIRPALLALALSLGAPALAQEMPTPRTDLDQVRKEVTDKLRADNTRG